MKRVEGPEVMSKHCGLGMNKVQYQLFPLKHQFSPPFMFFMLRLVRQIFLHLCCTYYLQLRHLMLG